MHGFEEVCDPRRVADDAVPCKEGLDDVGFRVELPTWVIIKELIDVPLKIIRQRVIDSLSGVRRACVHDSLTERKG